MFCFTHKVISFVRAVPSRSSIDDSRAKLDRLRGVGHLIDTKYHIEVHSLTKGDISSGQKPGPKGGGGANSDMGDGLSVAHAHPPTSFVF